MSVNQLKPTYGTAKSKRRTLEAAFAAASLSPSPDAHHRYIYKSNMREPVTFFLDLGRKIVFKVVPVKDNFLDRVPEQECELGG